MSTMDFEEMIENQIYDNYRTIVEEAIELGLLREEQRGFFMDIFPDEPDCKPPDPPAPSPHPPQRTESRESEGFCLCDFCRPTSQSKSKHPAEGSKSSATPAGGVFGVFSACDDKARSSYSLDSDCKLEDDNSSFGRHEQGISVKTKPRVGKPRSKSSPSRRKKANTPKRPSRSSSRVSCRFEDRKSSGFSNQEGSHNLKCTPCETSQKERENQTRSDRIDGILKEDPAMRSQIKTSENNHSQSVKSPDKHSDGRSPKIFTDFDKNKCDDKEEKLSSGDKEEELSSGDKGDHGDVLRLISQEEEQKSKGTEVILEDDIETQFQERVNLPKSDINTPSPEKESYPDSEFIRSEGGDSKPEEGSLPGMKPHGFRGPSEKVNAGDDVEEIIGPFSTMVYIVSKAPLLRTISDMSQLGELKVESFRFYPPSSVRDFNLNIFYQFNPMGHGRRWSEGDAENKEETQEQSPKSEPSKCPGRSGKKPRRTDRPRTSTSKVRLPRFNIFRRKKRDPSDK